VRAKIIGGTAAAVALAAPMGAYYEGVFPIGYADPVGIPTDCVGETQGAKVGVQRFTFEQCLRRYNARLQANWDRGLSDCIVTDVTVWQGAALLSFSDNAGIAATCGSTMVRMLNAGAPPDIWCAQMNRWVYAKKVGVTIRLSGLVKRRAAETALCLGNQP
jgi:lysozyme